MQDRQAAYLFDILRSAEVIRNYIKGYSREDFLKDPKTQDASRNFRFAKWPDCAIGLFTTTDRSTSKSYGKLSTITCLRCAAISVHFSRMKVICVRLLGFRGRSVSGANAY
jgi:hypothetical protein